MVEKGGMTRNILGKRARWDPGKVNEGAVKRVCETSLSQGGCVIREGTERNQNFEPGRHPEPGCPRSPEMTYSRTAVGSNLWFDDKLKGAREKARPYGIAAPVLGHAEAQWLKGRWMRNSDRL